jgi:cob(I)alamin adenosyltransferase
MTYYEFSIIEENDDLFAIYKQVFNEEGKLIYENHLRQAYTTREEAVERIKELCDIINNPEGTN